MQVSKITRQLIEKKYSTQQGLADALNPMPEGIEKVKQADVQRLLNAGRNIEKQFAVFLKLLELCKAQDLKDATEKEGVDHVIRHAAVVENTQQKKAVQNKKADIGAISPRKSASHSRR